MKLDGSYPVELHAAISMLKGNNEKGIELQNHSTETLLTPCDDGWEVWVDGDPVDYINPDAFTSARRLSRYLDQYRSVETPTTARRGFE